MLRRPAGCHDATGCGVRSVGNATGFDAVSRPRSAGRPRAATRRCTAARCRSGSRLSTVVSRTAVAGILVDLEARISSRVHLAFHLTFADRLVPAAEAGVRRVPVPGRGVGVAVLWYLRYGLSYRYVEELLVERGVRGRPRRRLPAGAPLHPRVPHRLPVERFVADADPARTRPRPPDSGSEDRLRIV